MAMAYPHVGNVWKNKASQKEKKREKKIHLMLIYIIQSANLNQHLFIL